MPIPESDKERLRIAVKKNLKPSLACYDELFTDSNYKIDINLQKDKLGNEGLQTFQVKLSGNEDTLDVSFKIILDDIPRIGGVLYKESYGLNDRLRIYGGKRDLFTECGSVSNFKTEFPRKPQILEGSFLTLKTVSGELPRAFYRLMIKVRDTDMIFPTSIIDMEENWINFDNPNFNFQDSLMGIPFMTTKGMFVKVKIKNFVFHVYAVEALNTYFIDCMSLISFEEFKEYSTNIRAAFAFLSGKYYRDAALYLFSENNDFSGISGYQFEVELPSITTNNRIINSIYFYKHFESQPKEVQDSLQKYHKPFQTEVFNALCVKLYENPDFLRSVEMIVKAAGVYDPIEKGAMYSVAIETITTYLREKNDKAFISIPDPDIEKKFKDQLLGVLAGFSKDLSEDGVRILTKKIEHINEPTNADKLSKSFSLYGIDLSNDEMDALKKRNNYLHGRKPINSDKHFELDQIALELHNIIGKLVLKHIGYEGHYINVRAWNRFHSDSLMQPNVHDIDMEEINRLLKKHEAGEMKDEEEIDRAIEKLTELKKLFEMGEEIKKIVTII